jgi:putative FmdB family regulatory protein
MHYLRRTARRMPTYVYGCDACGHRFERFQKFSDEPIRVCPECNQAVRRIFQPAGIVFKGSGWHITDYKKSGSNGSNGSETPAATDKSETKTNGAKAESTSTETSNGKTSSDAAAPAGAA